MHRFCKVVTSEDGELLFLKNCICIDFVRLLHLNENGQIEGVTVYA